MAMQNNKSSYSVAILNAALGMLNLSCDPRESPKLWRIDYEDSKIDLDHNSSGAIVSLYHVVRV